MRRLTILAWICCLVAGAVPAGAAVPPSLTFEALRQLVSVREPQIAPDGSRIVYVRAVGDFKADRERTELVLVDVASGRRRVLTRDRLGVHQPRWSPSGDRIAYLASPQAGKPAQLYVLPMDGGDSQRLTTGAHGVDTFAWRPDGGGFAYTAVDAPHKSGAPEEYVPAFSVTDEHYLTREPSRPKHVWTIDADGAHARQLTHGEATPREGGRLSWTPDGASLVVAMQPDPVFAHLTRARTMVVDVATGAARPVHADGVDDGGPLSHDGKAVALNVPRHGSMYLQTDVSVRDLRDGHEIQSGVAIDRRVHWSAWSADDTALFVGTADGVRNVLWRLPIGGAPSRVDLGEVDFAPDASVARDGAIAFVGQRPDDPGEIYVLPAGGAPRKLTSENAWLANYAVARRERVDWTSDDGTAVNGVLTYPTNYEPGKKYPLVLDIHGGPVSASTWGFGTLEGQLCQVLAAHGYLVLQPNYRGSDNAGDAFLNAIVGHMASGPGRDNLAGVAALERRGIVDPARVGVSGWSGGGLQTSWLIGHASYWRAAVSGAAVNDQYEQAVLADINEEFTSVFLGGATPWTPQGRALYRFESPITYVDAIRTPLLILSDTGDQRVPVTQAYELYHALRDRGRTVTFIAYPRAGHFPADPVGRESVLKQWSGWLERWMK